MILLDTSIVVAWLDPGHQFHAICSESLDRWTASGLVVSSITYAELASAGRTQESIDDDLALWERLSLDFPAAFRAGQAFRRWGRLTRRPARQPDLVLPDFFIRAQAAVNGYRHLTNDRRRLEAFPEVDFL